MNKVINNKKKLHRALNKTNSTVKNISKKKLNRNKMVHIQTIVKFLKFYILTSKVLLK